MNNIDRLLDHLHKMFPLSAGFWNDLQPMMTEKVKKDKHLFLKPGQQANKAWQLISGFIVVIREGNEGEEIVERIYQPLQIVTDLDSFFEQVSIRFKFVAVGDVTVLEINRADVMQLQQYPETNKLVQHIIFLDKQAADHLVQMLRQPVRERVKLFLEKYKISGLPARYCASMLNLSEREYLENKAVLQPLKEPEDNTYDTAHANDPAYKIKAYLMENYTQADLGDTYKIAKQFNTSTRTLNRLFVKTFGLTVSKFIVKLRMARAMELLKQPGLTVGQIALTVGYKNIFHFSKVFKIYYGYPPKMGAKR